MADYFTKEPDRIYVTKEDKKIIEKIIVRIKSVIIFVQIHNIETDIEAINRPTNNHIFILIGENPFKSCILTIHITRPPRNVEIDAA